LRFLIYEHTAGGGYAGEQPLPYIICEGYGMLKALTQDLKAAGHHTSTTLDTRLEPRHRLDADKLTYISSSNQVANVLPKMLKSADASLMIAPEKDGILSRLVEWVEEAGCISLNCPSETLSKFLRKSMMLKTLKKADVPVPRTFTIHSTATDGEVEAAAEEVGYPAVFKPEDGAGCSGLSLILNRSQATAAAELVRSESSRETFLIQEYISGLSASVNLLCIGGSAQPLTLNAQMVNLGEPEVGSNYYGGIVPLDHPLCEEALKVAKQAAEALNPVRGYVGVDLILTEERAFVVEVNMRLTTSYLGLREVIDRNLAKICFEAVSEGKLPNNIKISGYAAFSKVEISNPLNEKLSAVEGKSESFFPPIPLPSGKYCTITITSASTLESEQEF
jgi:predicted ATP-grasp superfamily ATP-dependent carboligase